jgi:hypothetical protein
LQLDVDEDNVDGFGARVEHLERLVHTCDGADDLRQARGFNQLDEIVSGKPLILDDESAEARTGF